MAQSIMSALGKGPKWRRGPISPIDCMFNLYVLYTKTGLVFGFSKNQILVAVILGKIVFGFIRKSF